MKLRIRSYTLAFVLALLLVPNAFGQDAPDFQNPERQKLGQTGMKFLSVSVDPRVAALGSASTAIELHSASAMFYNPAGMARLNGTVSVSAMNTQWIADIQYNAASVAFSPQNGRYGVFGISAVSVDYGEFFGTVPSENADKLYEEMPNFSPTALAVGVGYARALTDRFAVGGNVKYVNQNLGNFPVTGTFGSFETEDFSKSTVAFDFGVLYNTGFRSLNFAMSARNFSRELQYAQESFELPLTFQIGVSMDVLDFTGMNQDMHSLKVAVDAERPRDFAEQLRVGGEYLFMNTLALRAGYSFPSDEQGVTFGLGLQREMSGFGFAFNYAYTTFGVFDAVNRLGVQLAF